MNVNIPQHSSPRGFPPEAKTDVSANNPNDYETLSLSERTIPEVAASDGIYDFAPEMSGKRDEYDYESPYWLPSDQKAELLSQFRKLRTQSIAQKDLT